MKQKSIFLYSIIAFSVVIYFSFSTYVLPKTYLSLPSVIPLPTLTNIKISESQVAVGESFEVNITAANQGDRADIQIISVAFPNLTSSKGLVHVKEHDFTNSPIFIEIGDEIGSAYGGLKKTVIAKYPSIEAFGRPWNAGESHSLAIEVRPDTAGRFVMFVKLVALPHTSDLAHFPKEGMRDHQEEFVEVYSVVVQP